MPRLHRPIVFAAVLLSLRVIAAAEPAASRPAPVNRVGIIYTTDLFHPHDDPDDHFDLATLFALENVDLRAIVLDLGDRQKTKPGRIPLEQMMTIARRKVPYATGLSAKLESLTDTGANQPAADQAGVELLLGTLRASPGPVTIITAGSLRDVYAAFNRDPELLKRRVARLYINVGNADGANEWNVGLDRFAYIGIMRSGLPVYWCPCLPFRDRRSTFWEFGHAEVLETAPAAVQNFFIYALQVVPPELIDPQAALRMDLRPWRHLVWGMRRQMWCTASFLDAAGYKVVRTVDGKYEPKQAGDALPAAQQVFTFVPAHVTIDDAATTRLVDGQPANMQVFRTADLKEYTVAMTDCLRFLLTRLGTVRE